MAALFSRKKFFLVFCFLIIFLILPRIAVYFMFGSGIVSTDAELRYFPQARELSESLANFFHQNGPLYSLFLLVFEKLNINVVSGSVFVQHILGIITALLVFFYFKKINLTLAFFVTIFTYCNWIALWIEHTVLRDSLAAFLFVFWVIVVSFSAKDSKYFNFYFAFFGGLIGLALIFTRAEYLILFLLMPLILFVVRRRYFPEFKIKNRDFLKWDFGYFLPVLFAGLIYVAFSFQASDSQAVRPPYGNFFNIAYVSLIPEAYYYEGSKYPELLGRYHKILEANPSPTNNDERRILAGTIKDDTNKYLLEHPEINMSEYELMDKIYIEIMTKNILVYLKSFSINLKNQFLGTSETHSLLTKYTLSQSVAVERALRFYNIATMWFTVLLFWLSFAALPFLFIKWKKLPSELVMSSLLIGAHMPVIALLGDANHRFKYPIDPFVFFLQIYLVLLLFKVARSFLESHNFLKREIKIN